MENEEKNQTEQSDESRSVWRELWDYAKIIIASFDDIRGKILLNLTSFTVIRIITKMCIRDSNKVPP